MGLARSSLATGVGRQWPIQPRNVLLDDFYPFLPYRSLTAVLESAAYAEFIDAGVMAVHAT
jgi:hypothetical protein